MGRHAVAGEAASRAQTAEAPLAASLDALRGRAPRPAPGPTPLRILQAAMDVVVEGGPDAFVLRRVAEKAGLSLAALQHHFPTRAALVEELIEHEIDGYQRALAELLGGPAADPATLFLKVVDWALADAGQARTRAFSTYLWSLANTDAHAAQALDRCMALYRGVFAILIRRLSPRLSAAEAGRRAALVTVMIDGSMIVLGEGKPAHPEHEGLAALIRATALRVATERTASSPRGPGRAR